MEKEEQQLAEQERIAELEREVQRLRAKVEPEALEDDGEPISPDEMPYMPPKWRAVVIPILIGIGVFAAIIGVTLALASGFDDFARQAASSLVPDDVADTANRRGGSPALQRPAVRMAPLERPTEPAIKAPGL